MSTYAVFGMTKHRAIEDARKQVPTHREVSGDPIPECEWCEAVEKFAVETMNGPRVVQLSEKFDAPQFAWEFMELARKVESRSLHVKSYAKTGSRNPTTGKEIMAWNLVRPE